MSEEISFVVKLGDRTYVAMLDTGNNIVCVVAPLEGSGEDFAYAVVVRDDNGEVVDYKIRGAGQAFKADGQEELWAGAALIASVLSKGAMVDPAYVYVEDDGDKD